MALAINAGEVTRWEGHSAYPEHIVVDLKDNSRLYAPDISDLIVAILEHGRVLIPVEVRKIEDKKVRLVKGFRRHAALSFINAHLADGVLEKFLIESGFEHLVAKIPPEPLKLPFTVSNINAQEAFLRNLSENNDRMDTSIIEKAHNIRRLKEDPFNYDDARIGQLFPIRSGGVVRPASAAWISQSQKLLLLSDDLQKAIHNATYSQEIGYVLADMPEEAREALLALARTDKATTLGVDPSTVNVTVADVKKAARKTGLKVKGGRKMAELRSFLVEQDGPGNSLHARRFITAVLAWLDGETEDEQLSKEFTRRFKESS